MGSFRRCKVVDYHVEAGDFDSESRISRPNPSRSLMSRLHTDERTGAQTTYFART